ncbi:MFS general substrate transporter [Pyrenophora seminiperda CCB06]|uniref:MFS general substrate transporter n=1 Tax=Pyrenophora seminiperda CCB06 TaxID=1302712 RepID=A0A3M7LZG4_9PLEO|nr:MFS general substrate transporter [Pyrenophora seminiperda CCB06]
MCPVLYQILANTFIRSARRVRPVAAGRPRLRLRGSRGVATLPSNPHIYTHADPLNPSHTLLTLLPTTPPTPSLALGTCTSLPPPRAISLKTLFSSPYSPRCLRSGRLRIRMCSRRLLFMLPLPLLPMIMKRRRDQAAGSTLAI